MEDSNRDPPHYAEVMPMPGAGTADIPVFTGQNVSKFLRVTRNYAAGTRPLAVACALLFAITALMP